MSLILDALRKSEAERRRGQVPDLFAPVATRIVPAARPRTALLSIAILALAAAMAVVFWPKPTAPEKSRTDDGATGLPSKAIVATPMPAVVNPPAPPVRPAAAIAPASARHAVKPGPPTLAPIPPPPAPIAAPAPVANDAPPSIGNGADYDTDNQDATLPTLAALDSATRASVPPLQLSMHVWNEDAARRFAIIDGQRVGEGGRIGNVIVVGIHRDGVVLDVDGRQFLLPRP